MAVARKYVEPSTRAEEEIVEQMDELQQLAETGRTAVLGAQFFEEARRFYTFDIPQARRVAYHPMVRVADLQMNNLREAGELTRPKPKFFILRHGQRDEQREKPFEAAWRHFRYQLELLFATVYSGFIGTGVIQIAYEPDRDFGAGGVVAFARDPETYYPDPAARNDRERAYVILEDYQTYEEVIAQHGRLAAAVLPAETGNTYMGRGGNQETSYASRGLVLPPGPMRGMGPLGKGAFSGVSGQRKPGRLRKRTLFIRDATRLPFTDQLGYTLATQEGLIAKPDDVPAFPNGRLIVESERRIIYDGPNPYRDFPVFKISAFPALNYSYWAPPPVRFTLDLQILAEELFSQTFENAYRQNNVEKFIQRQSGLTAQDIDGLPGRVYFVDPVVGDKPVQTVTTPAFPPHFLEYPRYLIDLQRELLGMTPSRRGQAGAGNVGMGLFSEEVYQSQSLLRVRSAMLEDAIQNIAEFAFWTMIDTMGSREFPVPSGIGSAEAVAWMYDPQALAEEYQLVVDPASLRIDSATSLRNLALTLARFGKIDDKTLYEWLDVPDYETLAERMRMQMMMQAMAQGGQKTRKR